MVEAYGGLDGLRDAGMLASAVAMPQAAFDGRFLHTDLFEMAAAYLFHRVGNHPFLDGNKRAGAASALVFLSLSGRVVEANQDGLVEVTLRAATSQANKTEIAAFFRAIARPPFES